MGFRITQGVILLLALTRFISGAWADSCEKIERPLLLQIMDSPGSIHSVLTELDREHEKQKGRRTGTAYCAQLLLSIESLQHSGIKVSAERFINHAIRFEAFRLDTFISSGVAPKKYFGFFDEVGDTADFERIMRDTIVRSVEIINRHQTTLGSSLTVSEKEIALTFLAEGGALLLTNPEQSADRVHPVRGVGLDDFRIGFSHYADLVNELDLQLGTRLAHLTIKVAGSEILIRPMSFREAILGTAVMYLYEKNLAAKLMLTEWNTELNLMPVDKQFIATSLVYNSGIAFSPERIEQIAKLETGVYLDSVSHKSARPRLPLFSPAESLALLIRGDRLPQQLTSWNAVYHILQRYGAWIALERFSDFFDQSNFRRAPL